MVLLCGFHRDQCLNSPKYTAVVRGKLCNMYELERLIAELDESGYELTLSPVAVLGDGLFVDLRVELLSLPFFLFFPLKSSFLPFIPGTLWRGEMTS